MSKETRKYEPVPNPANAPRRFVWMKYEVPVLFVWIVIVVIWLFLDFGLLMRRILNGDPTSENNKTGQTIQGLSPGYFGIPRVIIQIITPLIYY